MVESAALLPVGLSSPVDLVLCIPICCPIPHGDLLVPDDQDRVDSTLSSLPRHCRGQGIPPQRQTDMWSFPAFSKDKELVWLRATRSQHANATRITHQAAIRLGFAQSVTKAYQIQLRPSSEPRFVLRAEGVETLECIRSRTSEGAREPFSRT